MGAGSGIGHTNGVANPSGHIGGTVNSNAPGTIDRDLGRARAAERMPVRTSRGSIIVVLFEPGLGNPRGFLTGRPGSGGAEPAAEGVGGCDQRVGRLGIDCPQ